MDYVEKLASDLRVLAPKVPLHWGRIQNDRYNADLNMFSIDTYDELEEKIVRFEPQEQNYFRRRWYLWKCSIVDEYLFCQNEGVKFNPNKYDKSYDIKRDNQFEFSIKGLVVPEEIRDDVEAFIKNPQPLIDFFYNQQSRGVHKCYQNKLFIVYHSFIESEREIFLRCAWQSKAFIYAKFLEKIRTSDYCRCHNDSAAVIFILEREKGKVSYEIPASYMKITKENWKTVDINIDSLWLIGPRAKGGKRENNYHGNFTPQVPDHLIRRYTEEGDIVLDPFTGSGTTLYECERLKRHFVGFDINQEIIDYVNNKMIDCTDIKYEIHNCDIKDSTKVDSLIKQDLKALGKQRLDFVIFHPPYWDVIKFTEKQEDLSNVKDLDTFIEQFSLAVENSIKYLRAGKHFGLVIGDVYRDGEVVPLGFLLMNAIKQKTRSKLKGIVVKDMVGNRAKFGLEALWRYRTLKSDTFLFKHEYIFVFKK